MKVKKDYNEQPLEGILGNASSEEKQLILSAFSIADKLHGGQYRASGEPYISHPLAVASTVSSWGLDFKSVAAALLHDTFEDTALSREELVKEIDEEVVFLVESLTKAEQALHRSRSEKQAATLRKMFIAMSQDVRVIIIKLADRLHNMRTLQYLNQKRQKRISEETLNIYAPLAHRIGMITVKEELENLAFSFFDPDKYLQLDNMVKRYIDVEGRSMERTSETLKHLLSQAKIEADIKWRKKGLWSIHQKMVSQGKQFEEIFDIMGMRIIANSTSACYSSLGIVHTHWTPLPGRFRDYIALPKSNLYQSLHTTVTDPEGFSFEVQIRTNEMDELAEKGIAAHWAYKDQHSQKKPNIFTSIESSLAETNPTLFLNQLKIDLDEKEIFVLTPKGNVITLPAESTPVDFAYSIHTDIGNNCIGSKIDGKLVALSTMLKSGDTVEIITNEKKSQRPSRDWLNFVVTAKAKTSIKKALSKSQEGGTVAENGQKKLLEFLEKSYGITEQNQQQKIVDDLIVHLATKDETSLYAAIEKNKISLNKIAEWINKNFTRAEKKPPKILRSTSDQTNSNKKTTEIYIDGLEGVWLRLGQCCQPLPPQPIIGYVTKDHGVSIHSTDCKNMIVRFKERGHRIVEASWQEKQRAPFLVAILVEAWDRQNLLSDIMFSISSCKANIVSSSTLTSDDRLVTMKIILEASDASQMETILEKLASIQSVFTAQKAFY